MENENGLDDAGEALLQMMRADKQRATSEVSLERTMRFAKYFLVWALGFFSLVGIQKVQGFIYEKGSLQRDLSDASAQIELLQQENKTLTESLLRSTLFSVAPKERLEPVDYSAIASMMTGDAVCYPSDSFQYKVAKNCYDKIRNF